jgi:thymidine kinase
MKNNPRFEIFTGPMFGGKTTRLLSALERYKYQNKNVLLFKPRVDVRYSEDSVVTHSGIEWKCGKDNFNKMIRVNSSFDLYRYFNAYNKQHEVDVVALDEAFMIDGVSDVLIDIYKSGKTVLVSSLQLSSNGEPYKEMNKMLPWATNIQICPAVCSGCGEDAYFTEKISGEGHERIEVGGSEMYQPKCFAHFINE